MLPKSHNPLIQCLCSGILILLIITNPISVIAGKDITIPDGTEIKLKLKKALTSSDAKVEDRIEFETSEDVMVKGVTVIKKGALAWGRIVEVKKSKSFGRSGTLSFSIDYVKAIDESNIRLRASREAKGEDKTGKAVAITLLVGVWGALVKGKNVEIPAGTEYSIYIDGEKTVKVD
jgi:hypothetical protein